MKLKNEERVRRRYIIVRESPLLAEIDFGVVNGLPSNIRFDNYPDYKERGEIRAKSSPGGRFWAVNPGGESQATLSFRVHSFFNDIFHTESETDDSEINHVIVAHGATNRAFIHMWTFKNVDWWSTFKNPANCSIYKLNGMEEIGYIYSPDN